MRSDLRCSKISAGCQNVRCGYNHGIKEETANVLPTGQGEILTQDYYTVLLGSYSKSSLLRLETEAWMKLLAIALLPAASIWRRIFIFDCIFDSFVLLFHGWYEKGELEG